MQQVKQGRIAPVDSEELDHELIVINSDMLGGTRDVFDADFDKGHPKSRERGNYKMSEDIESQQPHITVDQLIDPRFKEMVDAQRNTDDDNQMTTNMFNKTNVIDTSAVELKQPFDEPIKPLDTRIEKAQNELTVRLYTEWLRLLYDAKDVFVEAKKSKKAIIIPAQFTTTSPSVTETPENGAFSS